MALLACMFVPAGCTKEEDHLDDGLIEIFAESMSGNAKVLLDGASSTWVNGDPIRINSDEVNVVKMDGHAYINYPDPPSVNRAVYPASLTTSALTSDVVTLNFPAYYHYRTDGGGHQILELPMAAYSTDNNPLQFKHLTGALYVTVTNSAAIPLTLQSITVSSSAYQLNGNRSIDFRALEGIGGITTGTVDDRKVTMLFDTGHTLASGESVKVMIPVMPVGGVEGYKNAFTIGIRAHSVDQSTFYSYNRSQSSGDDHILMRNVLGYAPASITSGDEGNPELDIDNRAYVVRTSMDFVAMMNAIARDVIHDGDSIKIVSDIDMSGITIKTVCPASYYGEINGNNHVIDNLTIESLDLGVNGVFCGLFKNVSGRFNIHDISFNHLVLKSQVQTSKALYMGAIIAEYDNYILEGDGTIYLNNCNVNITSTIIENARDAIFFGGLIGSINNSKSHHQISNCSITISNQSISSNTTIRWGGIIGATGTSTTTIENSRVSAVSSLTAERHIYAGGLIGYKASSTLTATGCTTSGTIETSAGGNRYIGKMIGYYSTPRRILNVTGNTLGLEFVGLTPGNFGNGD